VIKRDPERGNDDLRGNEDGKNYAPMPPTPIVASLIRALTCSALLTVSFPELVIGRPMPCYGCSANSKVRACWSCVDSAPQRVAKARTFANSFSGREVWIAILQAFIPSEWSQKLTASFVIPTVRLIVSYRG
jgi:hypothetical protein